MAPSGAPDTGPDTAAIRALLAVGIYVDYHDALALCDALDAARTERDKYQSNLGLDWAALREAQFRAEAAEARIAAALVIARGTSRPNSSTVQFMVLALTKDTP